MQHNEKTRLVNGPVGYARIRILYNKSKIPIDLELSEANEAFLHLTGFQQDTIGKTLLSKTPNYLDDDIDWIKEFGNLDMLKASKIFESYSKNLKKWYTIHTFSTEDSYIECVLTLVPDSMSPVVSDSQLELKLYRNESLIRVMSYSTKTVADFLDFALAEAIGLTKSDIGYIYLYNEALHEFTLSSWSNKVMDACSVTEKQTKYQLEKTGFWGEVVRQKKAMINNDFSVPHHLKKGVPEGHAPLKKYMSLPIFDHGRIVAVVGLANKATDYDEQDIFQIQKFMEDVWMASKRKQAELELEHEKEHLKVVMDSISDGIISVSSNLQILTANEHAIRLLNLSIEEMRYRNILDILLDFSFETKDYVEKMLHIKGTHESKQREIAQIEAQVDAQIDAQVEVQVDAQVDEQIAYQENNHSSITVSKNARKYYMCIESVSKERREFSGYVVVIRDITDEFKYTEQILFMSYHDSLTNLYNRRFFEEEVNRLDTLRSLPISFIMGDVNGLKLTNDAFGHEAGDKLLVTVAKIMHSACRKEDILARWGGDEFVLLLPNTSAHRAKAICQTIRTMCEEDTDNVIDVSISLGYATKKSAEEDIQKIMIIAENNMYKNKLSEGKSQRSSIVEAIKETLNSRDHETEEHAERLLKYCMLLAEKLGLSDEETAELKLFAVLHDIGKIGIADDILLKPGVLNETEWYEMQKHPVIGYRIALSSVDLQHIAHLILHHHERWDGSGYPEHLAGEEIPLLARILAIADAYDAMTSNRPYRLAMSKEAAILELKNCSGTQFDKSIVSVFTKYI